MQKIILAVGICAAFWIASCGGASAVSSYHVYDSYFADYHTWGPDEGVYYNQWVAENDRENRDFRKLTRADQNAYWQWRHSHISA